MEQELSKEELAKQDAEIKAHKESQLLDLQVIHTWAAAINELDKHLALRDYVPFVVNAVPSILLPAAQQINQKRMEDQIAAAAKAEEFRKAQSQVQPQPVATEVK